MKQLHAVCAKNCRIKKFFLGTVHNCHPHGIIACASNYFIF